MLKFTQLVFEGPISVTGSGTDVVVGYTKDDMAPLLGACDKLALQTQAGPLRQTSISVIKFQLQHSANGTDWLDLGSAFTTHVPGVDAATNFAHSWPGTTMALGLVRIKILATHSAAASVPVKIWASCRDEG